LVEVLPVSELSTEDLIYNLGRQAGELGELRGRFDAIESQRIAMDMAQQVNEEARDEDELLSDEQMFEEFSEADWIAAPPTPHPRPIVPIPAPNSLPLNAQTLAAQGVQIASKTLPDWHRHADDVFARVPGNPAMERAFQSGQAANVAHVLAGIHASVRQSEASRLMKLNAQSVVGASGRPNPGSDDQQEWARILSAGDGGYAARRPW
jgi:hypothetical protein